MTIRSLQLYLLLLSQMDHQHQTGVLQVHTDQQNQQVQADQQHMLVYTEQQHQQHLQVIFFILCLHASTAARGYQQLTYWKGSSMPFQNYTKHDLDSYLNQDDWTPNDRVRLQDGSPVSSIKDLFSLQVSLNGHMLNHDYIKRE